MTYRLVIGGIPRTKKTSNSAFLLKSFTKGQPCPHCGKPIRQVVAPSKKWVEWVKTATVIMNGHTLHRLPMMVNGERILVTHALPGDGRPAVRLKALDIPLNLEALIYRDANRGDLFGFLQGLGDFLQEWGVVANDVLIRTTDRTRLLKDQGRPRIDVTLTPIEIEAEQLAVGLPDEDDEVVTATKAEKPPRA